MRPPDERRPLGEKYEIVRRDPDFRLDMFHSEFADTSNPYYAWQALGVCLKYKREIPDWLAAYLAQCIGRMGSDRAKTTRDLREALPWVLGFSKMKSGPGNLLDPDRDPYDKPLLALKFAIKIEQGEKPSTALINACDQHLDQARAEKIDEKTLRSWLVKAFDLKKWPRTNAEWKPIVRKHYFVLKTLIEERSHQIRKQSRETPP
jgi:hypothetical protein